MTVDKQHTKSIGRWVTGFIAVLVVGLLGSTAFGSLAHAAGTAGGDSPVAKAEYGPSLEANIGTLTAKCHATWPNEFGLVWLKPSGHPQQPADPEDGIFVGFTEGAEDKVAELAEDFPRPDLLVPVTVKHSLKELMEFQDRIAVDQSAARKGLAPLGHVTDGRFDMDADVKTGEILIIKPNPTSAFKNTFIDEYGPDGISFRFIDRELSGTVGNGVRLKTRLKKVNRKLRQTTKRFKRARVKYRTFKQRSTVQGTAIKRSYRQARKLKRQIVKQRQQKRKLVRKVRGLA